MANAVIFATLRYKQTTLVANRVEEVNILGFFNPWILAAAFELLAFILLAVRLFWELFHELINEFKFRWTRSSLYL